MHEPLSCNACLGFIIIALLSLGAMVYLAHYHPEVYDFIDGNVPPARPDIVSAEKRAVQSSSVASHPPPSQQAEQN